MKRGNSMNYVYHSSSKQNIKVFKPNKSTHVQSWVYATKDRIMSLLFISGIGGDFTCQIGRDPETGKPYICERFKGAFDLRYKDKKGSIYTLPGENFLEHMTGWDEEVVCPSPVAPIAEGKVHDAKSYLLKLKEENKLIIKYYPERIDNIPEDDEDLVERGIVWTRKFGERILGEIEKYHPHLLERVKRGLMEGKYL